MKYIDAEKLIATLERQNVDKKVIEPLIRIIDSLQQEQQEEPDKDLEEAAEEYRRETCNKACKNGFLDNHSSPSIKTTFIAGAEWQKEQMMKEAIAYVAQPDVQAGNIQVPFIRIGRTALFRYRIKVGDKVRIIIVKEDKKC